MKKYVKDLKGLFKRLKKIHSRVMGFKKKKSLENMYPDPQEIGRIRILDFKIRSTIAGYPS